MTFPSLGNSDHTTVSVFINSLSNCADLEERCMAKIYRLESLFSLVSKVFEKLISIRLVNRLEKCDLFFLISRMTLGLLTVVSDRIARAFKALLKAFKVLFQGF